MYPGQGHNGNRKHNNHPSQNQSSNNYVQEQQLYSNPPNYSQQQQYDQQQQYSYAQQYPDQHQNGYQQQYNGYQQQQYQDQNNYQFRRSGHGHGQPPPPPNSQLAFGHGAPEQYTYQYSDCSGRRKALMIGINYFRQKGELRGCINDVQNVSDYLIQNASYRPEDMVRLTDDQQNPKGQPTRENIIRAMHWLVKDAKPNDSLFFHYSGHGGQTEDLDGDEDDGYDEVIYPVDFQENGHIVDDDIHKILVQSLQPGVRLTAIFDSCHSGSCMDLPYIYSTQGILKEPNLTKETGLGLLGMVTSYAQRDIGKMLSTGLKLVKTVARGDKVYKENLRTKTSPADVIMWSGSKDDQTSADASISGQATGAMSYAFIKTLKANPQQSYIQMLNNIRDILESDYSQKPQLSCSHPLDVNLLFVM